MEGKTLESAAAAADMSERTGRTWKEGLLRAHARGREVGRQPEEPPRRQQGGVGQRPALHERQAYRRSERASLDEADLATA